MLMMNALPATGILRAEEIAMLIDVFEEISSSPQYLGDKPAREALAKQILHHYQSGVVDPRELKRRFREPKFFGETAYRDPTK